MQTRSSAGYQGVLKGMSLFLLLALVVTACGTPNPGPPPQQKQTLTSRLETFFTSEVEAKVFSGCVLIARADKVLFSKGYSMANWTQHVPNTPQTRFRLASVTKTFTAMAMLILQERGKLHVQ